MFVPTESSEILNLAQCIKIDVVGNEIHAYAPTSDFLRGAHQVARFHTAVEAGYAHFELFKALKAGKRTWDPYALKPLSEIWNNIETHFQGTDIPNGLTSRAHISAFDLDTVTITYDPQINRLLGKTAIAEYQKIVGKKLQELLGDAGVGVEWTC